MVKGLLKVNYLSPAGQKPFFIRSATGVFPQAGLEPRKVRQGICTLFLLLKNASHTACGASLLVAYRTSHFATVLGAFRRKVLLRGFGPAFLQLNLFGSALKCCGWQLYTQINKVTQVNMANNFGTAQSRIRNCTVSHYPPFIVKGRKPESLESWNGLSQAKRGLYG